MNVQKDFFAALEGGLSAKEVGKKQAAAVNQLAIRGTEESEVGFAAKTVRLDSQKEE